MAYIGRGINSGDAVSDHLTGSGATVYTLTYDTTTDGVVLSLDGVVQRNGTDFTILGTQLTFSTAVSSPIAIQVIYTGLTLSIGTPGTGTVGVSQLSSTGTASSSTYLRGDNSWATIPATADEITKSSSDPTATTNPSGGVGTVYLRTTTGEMYCCTDATTNANVWTNIGDGSGPLPVTYMSGTGGTITTDGSYKVHTFNSSGTFTPTIGNLSDGDKVQYLVIAGAGGGGSNNAGGGGAGGYRTATDFTVTNTGLTVTVGGGGAGAAGAGAGTVGNDSDFSSINSDGGGYGGGPTGNPGGPGGSGGGGAGGTAGGTSTASPNQGNDGGVGPHSLGGGGGGAGAAASGQNGGNGLSSSINSSAVTRAGGGGGYNPTGGHGTGGTGGGGNAGTAGTVNTGSGGGADIASGGKAGGSGLVIIRYQFQA